MTKEEKIRGLYNLKEYLVKNPIELDRHKSLPITLIDYSIESLEQQPCEDWLSSFNTDSATACYTAVQRLKEKIYDK